MDREPHGLALFYAAVDGNLGEVRYLVEVCEVGVGQLLLGLKGALIAERVDIAKYIYRRLLMYKVNYLLDTIS